MIWIGFTFVGVMVVGWLIGAWLATLVIAIAASASHARWHLAILRKHGNAGKPWRWRLTWMFIQKIWDFWGYRPGSIKCRSDKGQWSGIGEWVVW